MSETVTVPAGERGVVRVFALGYRVAMELAHFDAVDRLREALGLNVLEADDVQIVEIAALGDMTLSAFLTQGYDVATDEISPLRADLDALKGHVAVLRSGAFGAEGAVLAAGDQARLVATLQEPRMSAPEPVAKTYDSATGTAAGTARKPVSDAAMSGRIAMMALLFVFVLTILMVWIAS